MLEPKRSHGVIFQPEPTLREKESHGRPFAWLRRRRRSPRTVLVIGWSSPSTRRASARVASHSAMPRSTSPADFERVANSLRRVCRRPSTEAEVSARSERARTPPREYGRVTSTVEQSEGARQVWVTESHIFDVSPCPTLEAACSQDH